MRSVKPVSEYQFIERLRTQVHLGFGLVPFIGSGCSSQSGILMGEQFADYLAWTVFRCVAAPPHQEQRWDLRGMGWPPEPSSKDVARARRWVFEKFVEIARDCGLRIDDDAHSCRIRAIGGDFDTPDALAELLYAPLVPRFLRAEGAPQSGLTDGRNLRRLHALLRGQGVVQGGLVRPTLSPTSLDAIEERAIRSLYDWRATLTFLSELKFERSPSRPLLLLERDPTVIDRFNVHITQGKRPNFAHAMLCHLRLPARIRLILTTNFDTLIEEAFALHHRRIDTISVSTLGGLPDPEIVHARDTVIKLHGDLNETRADFSLDEPPSLEDRMRFLSYVRGSRIDDRSCGYIPAHLLVAGYSGSDLRCVQMMKFVLDSDERAQIFWICHNLWDRERLFALFPERAYQDRLIATVAERTDLLLFELYQRLTFGFPSGNQPFQTNYQLPPEISFRPAADAKEIPLDQAGQAIYDLISWHEHTDDERGQVVFIDGPSGVMRAMQSAFERFARLRRRSKAWFELEDFGDTAALAHGLFQLIAIERGLFNLNHAELCPPDMASGKSRLEQVEAWRGYVNRTCKHLGIEASQWVIAIYGRNGPGGCTGWLENQFWPAEEYHGPFAAFVAALAQAGMKVLYAPYTDKRDAHDSRCKSSLPEIASEFEESQKVAEELRDAVGKAVQKHFGPNPPPHHFASLDEFFGEVGAGALLEHVDLTPFFPGETSGRFSKGVQALLRTKLHTGPGPGRRKDPYGMETPHSRYLALYASALFRQSRHYSAFINEAVFRCPVRYNGGGIDNDLVRDARSQEWLLEFNQHPEIFFRKPGGFAWMYRDMRLSIRCLAETIPRHRSEGEDALIGGVGTNKPSCSEARARSHIWIGNWYLRAFQSSSYATSLMEAAFHFFQAALHSTVANRTALETDERRNRYRMNVWRTATNKLVTALRMGGRSFQFWFSPAQATRWFDAAACDLVRNAVRAAWDALASERRSIKPELPQEREAEEDLLTLLDVELCQCRERYVRSQSPHIPRSHRYRSIVGVTARRESATFTTVELESEGSGDDDVPDKETWPLSPPRLVPHLLRAIQPFVEGRDAEVDKRGIGNLELERFSVDPAVATQNVDDFVNWSEILLADTKWREHAWPVAFDADPDPKVIPAVFRTVLRPMELRRRWVRVCVFARCALDASHWVFPGPDQVLSRRLHKAHCIYGLALARLHRFREAHRRFGDAQALAIEHREPERILLDARVDVRRAEAYLIEASLARELVEAFGGPGPAHFREAVELFDTEALRAAFLGHSGGTTDDGLPHPLDRLDEECRQGVWNWLEPRVQAAREEHARLREPLATSLLRFSTAQCDSAWRCLERAAGLFGGRSSSPRWWGRLRALQLRVLATSGGMPEPSSRPLAKRIQSDLNHRLEQLWQEGTSAAPDDTYNIIRVLDYYARALVHARVDARQVAQLNDTVKEIVDRLARIESKTSPERLKPYARELLELYTGNVAERLEMQLKVKDARMLVPAKWRRC